jgi:hypothetical protein
MSSDSSPQQPRPGQDYLGVMFECCHVYTHIHKNKAGTAYVGWCPKCAKKLTIRIDPSGTDSRFFKAY